MSSTILFTRKDRIVFGSAGLLVLTGLLLMAFDPAMHGFGILTLWISPPLLLVGFILPAWRLSQPVCLWRIGLQGAVGYGVLLVAFLIYLFTLEPTASLWDCSEFIPSAFKLQVPHTPGTPLALLLGRVFAIFSFGETGKVAWAINLMSAFFSSLAVWMVYRLILFFCNSISCHGGHAVAAAAGGALVLAVSDTFWFSAVEAETYGCASFFLLLLVWLIVTGSPLEGQRRTRRLLLIFYVSGLAYCVHPMCLLALIVLPYRWMHSGNKSSLARSLGAVALGLAIVFSINRFMAIGLADFAFTLDRILVNGFGLPFYSGVFLLFALICLTVRRLVKIGSLQPYLLSAVFLVVGFTPYLMLFIRSNHNPPIDETNPETLPLIKSYMNRESYPTAPLLYGPYFDADIVDIGVKKLMYFRAKDRYEVAGSLPEYRYDSRQTLLPRLYSHDANHVEAYRAWLGLRENERPGFDDNLYFLFSYQLGHMYLRYLLWNFAGRESDEQGSDWLRPWDGLSSPRFEKARNQYWMIPFVIGIIGAVLQYRRDRLGFVTVLMFFLTTGAVLAIYLNSPPVEPRERDYIYVGSFIAYSIWIGLGLFSLRALPGKGGTLLVIPVALAVPLWMGIQNYDDHDRSGRTLQADNARNILQSCAPNSILFTGGDNDTFPLWYLQEVEGFRTDVRVMVLSYMNTDWYINQLRSRYYKSEAFALTLDEHDYRQYGPNDVLYVQEIVKDPVDARTFLDLLRQKHEGLRRKTSYGDPYHILPSRKLIIPGKKGEDDFLIQIQGPYLSKNLLAILDLLVSNGWSRPVYFNFTSMNSLDADISKNVIQEGPVFRLQARAHGGEGVVIDTDLMFHNLVTVANYDNLLDKSVHFSYEDHFARIIVPIRQSFNLLAEAFLSQGNEQMARNVMEFAVERLYPAHLRPSYTNLQAAELLLALNEKSMAKTVTRDLLEFCSSRIKYARINGRDPSGLDLYLLERSEGLIATIEQEE